MALMLLLAMVMPTFSFAMDKKAPQVEYKI